MHNLYKFFTYTAIGSIGSAGHFAVLIGLVEILNSSPLLASSLGFLTGGLINYFLNHKVTFTSVRKHRDSMPKFTVVAILGFCSNGLIMYVGTMVMQSHYLFIQIVAAAFTLILTFSLNSHWTFRK